VFLFGFFWFSFLLLVLRCLGALRRLPSWPVWSPRFSKFRLSARLPQLFKSSGHVGSESPVPCCCSESRCHSSSRSCPVQATSVSHRLCPAIPVSPALAYRDRGDVAAASVGCTKTSPRPHRFTSSPPDGVGSRSQQPSAPATSMTMHEFSLGHSRYLARNSINPHLFWAFPSLLFPSHLLARHSFILSKNFSSPLSGPPAGRTNPRTGSGRGVSTRDVCVTFNVITRS